MATHQPCGKTWTGTKIEHCPVCCESFSGSEPGDAHRVGSYQPDERRCLTDAEMLAGGMWRGTNGVWHGRIRKTGVRREQRTWPKSSGVRAAEGPAGPSASPRQGDAPDGAETAVRGDAA